MITIPTCELVNLLATATGFAAADKDDVWFGVLLEWDGESLHASGYDTLSGARVTWTPYEGAESRADENDETGDMHTDLHWGGNDDSWRVFVSVLAAKEIVKTFKLPAKHALTPVTVKVTPTGASLIVERSRETGHSQHLGMWPNDADRAVRFPDVARLAGESVLKGGPPVTSMRFNPFRLAAFAAAPDTVEMLFGDDAEPTAMVAGARFVGFIYPAGANTGAAGTDASIGGRTGEGKTDAGVLLETELMYRDDPEAADILSGPN